MRKLSNIRVFILLCFLYSSFGHADLFSKGYHCSGQFKNYAALLKQFQESPMLQREAKKLTEKLQAALNNQQASQQVIFDSLASLNERGILERVITGIIHQAKARGKISDSLKMNTQELTQMIMLFFRAELYGRGYLNPNFKFKEWDQIIRSRKQFVESLPATKNFQDQSFLKAYQIITGQQNLKSAHHSRLVIENSDSLQTRLKIIKNAKKYVYMKIWGYHDDESAKLITQEFINAHKSGVTVRIIVDGLTAKRPGYNQELARLENAGIPVIYWRGTANPFYGMHAKVIMNENEVLSGGRNIGDSYLQDQSWRDLERYYRGGSFIDHHQREFVNVFNQQIQSHNLQFNQLTAKNFFSDQGTQAQYGLILHKPNQQSHDRILDFFLYAFRHAREEIDIAQAYLMDVPPLTLAIKEALARGVKVRIHMNSNQSVDEPVLSIPLIRTAKELADHGAEIYLQVGETVHTKALRIDQLEIVTSYNFHPRSHHYELENLNFSISEKNAKEFKQYFNGEIANTQQITEGHQLEVPPEGIIDFLISLFFNQL